MDKTPKCFTIIDVSSNIRIHENRIDPFTALFWKAYLVVLLFRLQIETGITAVSGYSLHLPFSCISELIAAEYNGAAGDFE